MSRVLARRSALTGFAVATALNLLSLQLGATALEWATKPLLTLLLLVYVAASPPDRDRALPAAGLCFALAGDVLLMFDGTAAFALGIAGFAGMQICYIRTFVRRGALKVLLGRPVLLIGYACVLAATGLWLIPKVDGALTVLVAVYGLLLTSNAAVSAGAGWTAGLGGALFLISDTAIAADAFAGVDPPAVWFVMATYAVAQVLLVTAMLCPRHPPERTETARSAAAA